MNILLVLGTLAGNGGIETCIRAVSLQAKQSGDEINILALCPSTMDGRWHEGLPYTEVKKNSAALKWQAILGFPAVIRELFLRKPDVVVVIYSSTVPIVKAALAISGFRIPIVSWLHFSLRLPQRTHFLKYADAHLCINSQNAIDLGSRIGIPVERIHLIFNGARICNSTQIPRSVEGALRLLYVGRVMVGKQKRTDDLLRALSLVTGEWQLDVIGTGVDLPEIKELADQLGIADRVVWHGWQPEPWLAVDVADAFDSFICFRRIWDGSR